MEHRPAPGHSKPGRDTDAVFLPGEVHRTEPFRDEGAEFSCPVAGKTHHGIDAEGGKPVEDTAFTHG